MENPQRYSCAVVTGASSGLGEEFALQLAPRVGRLVLVARRGEMLEDLAQRIGQKFSCEVIVLVADLACGDQRAALIADLKEKALAPDLLVNNAGLGDYGEFHTADWEKLQAMLRVNIEALVHLTHALVPGMIGRERAAVINVSSLASILPIPDFAVYAATKACVTSFSEALRIELKEHGIEVLALCPGPVRWRGEGRTKKACHRANCFMSPKSGSWLRPLMRWKGVARGCFPGGVRRLRRRCFR
jgi:short-subunit dehydrogenase